MRFNRCNVAPCLCWSTRPDGTRLWSSFQAEMLHPSCSCLLTLIHILQEYGLNSNGGLEATRVSLEGRSILYHQQVLKGIYVHKPNDGTRGVRLAHSKQVRRNSVADERSRALCHTASHSESSFQPQITFLKWFTFRSSLLLTTTWNGVSFRSFLPLTMGMSIRTSLAPSPTLSNLALQTTSFFK
jgi:hypothetical protein